MRIITRITPPVRGRCRILVDDKQGFSCPAVAVEKLGLKPGMELTADLRQRIDAIALQSKCRSAALRFLAVRDHSRAELTTKLDRRFDADLVQGVVDDLTRHDVLNDQRFAQAKMESSARRHHGPARALADLHRSGVASDTADAAIKNIYNPDDRLAVALDLARRQLPRLSKLPKHVAIQRLAGMLARRGFDEDDTRSVVEKTLGPIED